MKVGISLKIAEREKRCGGGVVEQREVKLVDLIPWFNK
jgi:hypothetical protein